MEHARIAFVRYLNTRPLVEGLERLDSVELVPAAPSHIARLLVDNRADIGLASLIDAARSPVPLRLIPSGMIGCDGPTLTVRLYSAVPFERVARLHADAESHTSVALARIILAERFGTHPGIVEFDARERIELTGTRAQAEWPETLLLIGDKVVTDEPPAGRYPHQLDLGQAWRDLTGFPFVYAVWMCREEDAACLGWLAALLDRQLRHNLTRLDWIVRRRAPEHRWPIDLASRYLSSLMRYRVGERERLGAAEFLARAAAMGLAPRPARWADPVGVRPASPTLQ